MADLHADCKCDVHCAHRPLVTSCASAAESCRKELPRLHCLQNFQQWAMGIYHPLKMFSKLTMASLGSTDSNQAVSISLVTLGAGELQTLHSFHPKFTYAIFGDEERIFGYQGLKINLRYNACDMRPNVQIFYHRKFRTVGETSATDLKAILEGFLPKSEHLLLIY
jgi:hypothetical protein